jgi:hypothetical protein
MSFMFGGMNVSASRGDYLKDMEKKRIPSRAVAPSHTDAQVVRPVFSRMNASLEPSSGEEEEEDKAHLDVYEPPLEDSVITALEMDSPASASAFFARDEGDAAAHALIRRAKQRRVWQELMMLTEQYVAVEYFAMDVAVQVRDKARKTKALLEHNEIHDEIQRLVHPDPSMKPQLSPEAAAYVFRAIDADIDTAMVDLDTVQRKLYGLQEEKSTAVQRILECQDSFHNVSVFHQFEQIRAPQKQLWDQFKKDVVRENIKFTGECLFHSPASSAARGPVGIHSALHEGPVVHRCSGSNFLVFLKSFLTAQKFLHSPGIEKVVFGCLPDLIGRTVNAGLPYDVVRVLICHPETECLSPVLHKDPRDERIKLKVMYNADTGALECGSRMVNCFRLIPTGGESEIRRIAVTTHTTVRIDFAQLDCTVCGNKRTWEVVTGEAKKARADDPLLALDISKLPAQFHKTQGSHMCVLEWHRALRDAMLLENDHERVLMTILQYINPFWFVHLTRIFVMEDIDIDS